MKSLFIPPLLLLPTAAYTIASDNRIHHPTAPDSLASNSRRRFLLQSIAGSFLASSLAVPARAVADDDSLQQVYFGAGCFWHVQHEFVAAERNLLGRKDDELTSRAGYAGGLKTDDEGRVCYHNFQAVADYGKLGHGEVVGMTVPESAIGDFALEYFKLFGDAGERADPMDKGGEYRSLLGLPGGTKHPKYPLVEEAANARGMKLVEGKGNDPDTLGKRIVYVMDSNKFPFYQAEVYHQYHNDFLSPPYGKEYNNLVTAAVEDGRIKITGCPDRMFAVKRQVQSSSLLRLVSFVVGISLALLLGVLKRATRTIGYSPIAQYGDKDSETVENDDNIRNHGMTEMVPSDNII
ncbi:hypothetical protein ACHAW6_010500 [Cyclotella cf. meneghiniana]